MPATSEARIAANRKNATLSRGPTTPEGKERSRRNGLKHGMTGRGVVLIEEDASEVARRSAALMAELAPRSTLGTILVGQLATLSVRMERGAKREETIVASRVRHSAEAFDRERVERAGDLFQAMLSADDPRPFSGELRQSPEGIDRLVAALSDMRADLTHPKWVGWSDTSFRLAAKLAGSRLVDFERTRLAVLSDAAQGRFHSLAPEDGAGLEYQARRRWAGDRILEWVDAELESLKALRETLDFEAIELDRADAADLALFDPSPEASLARRYESEARRAFFKALKEFRQVEAEADVEPAPEPEAEPSPEVAPPRGLLGSCRDRPLPIVPGRLMGPAEAASGLGRPSSAVESAEKGLDGHLMAVGRASFGAG